MGKSSRWGRFGKKIDIDDSGFPDYCEEFPIL